MTSKIYRLSEARELRGYTVAEFAEKIGVTRQAVYKYEGGTQRPNNELMDKIVEVLNFPLSFFMKPHVGMQLDERPIFFRDMKTDLKKNRNIARRWIYLLVDRVAEYEKYLELPEDHLPQLEICDFKDLSDEDIDNYAEQTRRYWNLGDGPISDLTLLLENNGVIVAHKDVLSPKLDACSMIFNGRPYILVNTHKQTCSRVLMNLAHELAHIVLHQGITIEDIEKKETLNVIEKQAKRFAASFLMPPAVFSNEVGYPSLSQFLLLKKRWRTSIASMIMHSRAIGLISEERKQYFFRELSRSGWRKKEPLDDELPIEKSSLLFECEKTIVDSGLELKDTLYQNSSLSRKDYIELISAPDNYFIEERKKPNLRLLNPNTSGASN